MLEHASFQRRAISCCRRLLLTCVRGSHARSHMSEKEGWTRCVTCVRLGVTLTSQNAALGWRASYFANPGFTLLRSLPSHSPNCYRIRNLFRMFPVPFPPLPARKSLFMDLIMRMCSGSGPVCRSYVERRSTNGVRRSERSLCERERTLEGEWRAALSLSELSSDLRIVCLCWCE